MNELKKYQTRVNKVSRIVNGRDAKYMPDTIDKCIALLNLWGERYNVTY